MLHATYEDSVTFGSFNSAKHDCHCQNEKLHLNYSFLGLGSNRFKTFPITVVEGQTLFYKEKSDRRIRHRTQLKAGALDSIEQIISSISDTAVERINPCILSGGIYRPNVVSICIPFSRWQREKPCIEELRRRADSMQKQKRGVQK